MPRQVCGGSRVAFRRATLLLSGSIVGSMLSVAAAAQEAPLSDTDETLVLSQDSQADEAMPVTQSTVGDIIVTAQKREQLLQTVPASIQAVTGDTIQAQGTPSLEALSIKVPSLHISYAGLSEQLFIRGVGSGSNFGFEQSVGLFLDGIALSVPRLSRLAFMDVERVEVLKGPQSVLFGKSTIAGAVSITSGQPRFGFEGSMIANYDIDGDTRRSLEGYVTGPLSENVAVRLAGQASTTNGAFYNTLTDQRQPQGETYSGRLSLLATPTDNFEILATVQGTKADSLGRSAQIGRVETQYANVQSFMDKVLAADPDADFETNRFRSSGGNDVPCDECGDDKAYAATLRMSLDTDDFEIVSLTGYLYSKWREQIDADATPLPIRGA